MTMSKLYLIPSLTTLLSNLHIHKLYRQQLGATSQQMYCSVPILAFCSMFPLMHLFTDYSECDSRILTDTFISLVGGYVSDIKWLVHDGNTREAKHCVLYRGVFRI